MTNTLKKVGFDDWFQEQLDTTQTEIHEVARVVAVHKNRYVISNGEMDVFAELSGHLFYTADSSTDLPTVGDWVYADFYDEDTHAIIHGVIPRKTLLKRKVAGKLVDLQLIAANIDVAFIIQSADYNFNLRRLERYLVMVNEGGITPVVLLSKCDLVSQSEVDELKKSITEIAPNVRIVAFSSLNGDNIDGVKEALIPCQTYCLLGSSGVGKTTLLNNLLGSEQLRTQSVSKKQNKGKHTTTSRELILLDNGAMLIDTPGMRELGNLSIDAGMDETFSDISALAEQCKFGNCTHTNEKGCAILAAIESGALSKQRYENYLKMKKESAFNELTYFEKRQKDKNFGKLVKATMKNKNR
ncbi:ribosome small subunit-dependent GTPase A [Hydrogenovibrio marinus]|uniref:Small ribosomal subunit biogenesis GTPase RsgA n=1 Tax=Hydrogenovibrio marinus TaxID=28885 RepID=A0A066ZQZ9_HYDMR|nr:ribosome small subunit-dependent GTPase A [Hydrogenovibrio marinus]KDN96203.1 GTP-binding protein [Hydrogenovibrio marinus]BBN60620.1 putative ribosome biogenesis GTPase RsgA [Hydrogenovibrio marinus]